MMNRAFSIEWDSKVFGIKAWRVWTPISDKRGNHLSHVIYPNKLEADKAADRWNQKHGIK